jgi:Rrf2 family nitric oxide-sensitive transcriptional repressor
MRLTAFTDYSLRVLIYLAIDPDRRATISEIAAAFKVSESHLMKIVHFLGKEGMLANVRGKGGGITLARPPAAINVGEVVRLTEAGMLPAECFDRKSNACVITPACRLRGVLQEAVEAFYDALGQYTLTDLMRERQALTRILAVPDHGSEIVLRRLPAPRSRRRA